VAEEGDTGFDDDEDEPDDDDEHLPKGTPIPPSATGWFGRKTAVKDYAPRRARSAAGSPSTPATALPTGRRTSSSKKRRPRYEEYWSQDQVDAGVSAGTVFVATLRVNPNDRSQAFVTVPGLTSDILVKGAAQNRGVDLDQVAVQLLPPPQWHHMKGGALPPADALARADRMDTASSGGSTAGSLRTASSAQRRTSQSTSVPAIQEGILDNDAIEEGEEETPGVSSSDDSGGGRADDVLEFEMDDEGGIVRSTVASSPIPTHTFTWPRPSQQLHGRLDALNLNGPVPTMAALGGVTSTGRSVRERQPLAPLHGEWAAEREATRSPPPAVVPPPLSASWGVGGGTWTGLQAFRGQPLPVSDPPINRFQSYSASASVLTSARSVASLGSLEDAAVQSVQLPVRQSDVEVAAAMVAAINQLLYGDPFLRATGQVVKVVQPSRRRTAVVGVLKEEGNTVGSGGSSTGGLLFLDSRDAKLPRCVVQPSALPPRQRAALVREARRTPGQLRAPDAAPPTLVAATLQSWDGDHAFPSAQVEDIIGPAGDLKCETQALLTAESAPTSSEFDEKVLRDLPAPGWVISDEETRMRQDLREERIFSIDPPTARDLDDALSVSRMPNGNLRVGVHIADVSHFVQADSPLDEEARRRGTSVYLVDRVIPMLPRRLCEELCSLLPGTPRLAFSIIWELTQDGKIVSQWAGRSVICTCAKLAYQDAQAVIDALPQSSSAPAPPSLQLHGGHTWDKVAADVVALHGVAQARRAARQRAGALRLDNTKLDFQLGPGGKPVSCSAHVQREANQLVEEFMLLANIQVALIISDAFPDRSLLRCHPEPNARKLAAAAAAAKDVGLKFDTSSAGALAASLRATLADPTLDAHLADILHLLFTKPMQLAHYFCTGDLAPPQWRHYALGEPVYTHFTSPIRRYPDVIVHRLLAAALAGQGQTPQPQPQQQQQQAHAQPKAQQPQMQRQAEAQPQRDEQHKQQPPQMPAVGGVHQDRERGAPGQSSADRRKQRRQHLQPKAPPQAPPTALSSDGLPSQEEISVIAAHCNDTKLSAKTVQDACSKLHLGALLRDQPVAARGVVTSANGGQWLDVYVPAFGHEGRILTSDMPCTVAWNPQSRRLMLSVGSPTRRFGLGRSSGGGGGGQGGTPGGAPGGTPPFSNPLGVQPLALPVQLRTLDSVPVVLCHNADPAARLGDIKLHLLL